MHPFTARLIAGACVLSACAGASAQSLVFADILNTTDPDGNSIRMVGTDGNGLHTVVATGTGVRGVDVDPNTGLVYWTDAEQFAIRRARLDGTGQQDLITDGLGFPSAIRLDLAAGTMYWGDQTNNEVNLANLDGSGRQNPFGDVPFFRGLAIDHANARVYWTTADTGSTGRIVRSDFDGNNQVTVVGGSGRPGNIAIDVQGGKIYWTDAIATAIRRANLDGSDQENLLTEPFVGPPKGITLDLANSKVYWGQEVDDFDSGALVDGQIRRMNLDGTEPELVVDGLGSVNDLVLVPAATCAADFNHDGHLTVQDIFDFLSAWFAGDPSADFNHANGLTVQDIFDFLSAWFAGCA